MHEIMWVFCHRYMQRTRLKFGHVSYLWIGRVVSLLHSSSLRWLGFFWFLTRWTNSLQYFFAITFLRIIFWCFPWHFVPTMPKRLVMSYNMVRLVICDMKFLTNSHYALWVNTWHIKTWWCSHNILWVRYGL